MKKVSAIITSIGYLLNTAIALAAPPAGSTSITVTEPSAGLHGDVGTIISNAIKYIIIVATIAVLFMLVIGAFQWITSGGDKEAVSKARSRIVNALIGLAIIAVAFIMVQLLSILFGVDFFKTFTVCPLTQNC